MLSFILRLMALLVKKQNISLTTTCLLSVYNRNIVINMSGIPTFPKKEKREEERKERRVNRRKILYKFILLLVLLFIAIILFGLSEEWMLFIEFLILWILLIIMVVVVTVATMYVFYKRKI